MARNDGKDLFGLGRAFGGFAPGLMPKTSVSLKGSKPKRRKPIAPRERSSGQGPRAKRERM